MSWDNSQGQATGQLTNPSPSLLDNVLKFMRAQGASDLHLSRGKFLARVHGELKPLQGIPVQSAPEVVQLLSTLTTKSNWDHFVAKKELDCAYTTAEGDRFRVNLFVQRGQIGAVFRSIPTEIKTLDQLGMPRQIGKLAKLNRGLVLVTGPTGSGKSTTLAALVNEINETRAEHIMTVEDPIEFIYESKTALINQREVGADTETFSDALRHVLRQDPDVILIGELRDLETISAALTAAETGHLVFGTLHTQDASQTIDRIIDVFPPHQQALVRTQLSTTLKGIICQNLVRTANGNGRVAATEILFSTPAISNLIREGKTYQISSAIQGGIEAGMQSMDQSLANLVKSQVITAAAGMEQAHDKLSFGQLVPGVNFG